MQSREKKDPMKIKIWNQVRKEGKNDENKTQNHLRRKDDENKTRNKERKKKR